MIRRALVSFGCIMLVLGSFAGGAAAQWLEDGNPIAVYSQSQTAPVIAPDGEGGAFIAWRDMRNDAGDIYIQRLDSHGRELWTAGGIRVTPSGSQEAVVLAPDGEGGVILAWQDYRSGNYDIYAQRIDAEGNELWTSGGQPVCTATSNQMNPDIDADGSGGAIIVWEDLRAGYYDIYAQRLNDAGDFEWTYNGEAICTEAYDQVNPATVVDAANGCAYFSWQDGRTGSSYDIYAHKWSISGSRYWAVNGITVCTATNGQYDVRMILDATSNVIICWRDYRGATGNSLYAQALNASGVAQWTADGEIVCSGNGTCNDHVISAASYGGALVAWEDNRDGTYRARAQKMEYDGSPAWTDGGLLVCGTAQQTRNPRIATDGLGGGLVVYGDFRHGPTGQNLYMQHVDASGSLLWSSTGALLTAAPNSQYQANIAADGRGGAIVSWTDSRNPDYDIYAGRMDRSGNWGFPAPGITSVRDVPGDQGGSISLAWDGSRLDAWPVYDITKYSVWRAIDQPAALLSASNGAAMLSSAGDLDTRPTGDVIRRGTLAGEPYYWMLVSYADAYAQEHYAQVVSTLFDSTEACAERHYFQVIAHTEDRTIFWESLPDSGCSVDNLAPAQPVGLAGEQSYAPAGLLLTWDSNTEPDLAGYNIYRGTSGDFVPGPGNFIASEIDTATFDGDWLWDAGYWYKVAALDIHGNESVFAVLAPGMITGDDPVPLPNEDFLRQNYPNPFNPVTSIAFGIEKRGHVSLRVYDASGRLVATLLSETRPAGRYTVEWDGRGTDGTIAASGVYFYKLNAGSFEKTRKMILLR